MNIQTWTAPSGARVYFVESHDLPIVDLSIDFAAGSAYDPADKAGLAGFTRGLFDAGAGSLDEDAIAEKGIAWALRADARELMHLADAAARTA